MEITVYAMTIMMAGYLRAGKRERGKEIYDSMISRGISPTSITFVEILRSYALDTQVNNIALAEEFIKEIISTPVKERGWEVIPWHGKTSIDHIYAPLMWAYSRKQQPEDVERIFGEMLEKGGEPTVGTLTALLDAYRRTQHISGAVALWPHIFELGLRQTEIMVTDEALVSPGQPPRRVQADYLCIPLSIYIDALSAAQRFSDVAAVWKSFQEAGLMFNSHNYNHLVLALVRAGEIERAFEILEKVILPFGRKFKTLRRSRDKEPASPLIFDDEVLGLKPLSPSDPPLQRATSARQRRFEVRANKWHLGNLDIFPAEEDSDLALPLYLLQQISPGWNYWAPHQVTLTALLMIVVRLREGMLREAMNLHELPSEIPPRSRMDLAQEREEASVLLSSLQDQYPDAYQAVSQWEVREHRRLAQARFDQKYYQSVMSR